MDKSDSFSYKTKRFLNPLTYSTSLTAKLITKGIFWGFFGIFNVLSIKQISNLIEIGEYNSAIRFSIIYLIVLTIYFIISYFIRQRGWGIGNFEILGFIQKEYLDRFVNLDSTQIEKLGTGKMINIFGEGSKTWTSWLLTLTIQGISSIINLIFSFVLIIWLGTWYGLAFLVLFIIIHIFVGRLNKKAVEPRRKRKEVLIEASRHMVKIIMSKNEVLQNEKINQELEYMDDNYKSGTYYNKKVHNYVRGMFKTPQILTMLLTFGILMFFAYYIPIKEASFSDFVTIVAVLGLMKGTIFKTVDLFKMFTNEFIQIEKMWDTFDNIPTIHGYKNGKRFIFKQGEIKLENISFKYEDNYVLDKLSLDIIPKQKTALVGPSGGGKTTLIKLISGYMQPDKGKVFVDGQDLSQTRLIDYYKHIGYLTQDPGVFDGSIIDNLTYALKKKPTNAQLEKVIKMSKCEFIKDFKKGLKTEIGERGVRLSGGQKQRLAIAKIMLKDPKIILLDEPTSALDSVSEQKISQALHNLFKGKTVIIIAHRLQTVKQADEIIVIDKGKVVDRGTHKQLEKRKGLYKQMLDLQTTF